MPATPENGKAEVHILTGENGTGKTSILEAIGALFVDSNSYNGSWEAPARIRREESYMTANLKNGLPLEYGSSSGFKVPRSNVVRITPVVNPSFSAFAYSGYRKSSLVNVIGVQDISEHPLAQATDLNKSIDSKIFLQWLVNTQARELITKGKAESVKALQIRQNLSIVERALTTVTSQTVFFELEDNPFGAKINVNSQSLTFDEIPDGLKSMVSWLGDLLMRMDRIQWADDIPVLERPFLLLLDEIDVHLHPAWQRKILPMVQSLFPNAQVIVSTHSPFVVGSVDGAWVHKFVKKDGFSVIDGPPILSEDARSYEYILEEIFGIKERFGIEVEKKLAEFQQLKKQLLKRDETVDESHFRQLIDELRGQSAELDSLLGMELKQLERLTQRSFVE